MTIAFKELLHLAGSFTKPDNIASANQPIVYQWLKSYGNGNGEFEAESFWGDTITLAASPQNIDLYGTFTDIYSDPFDAVSIKAIYMFNLSTVAGEDIELTGNFIESILGGISPMDNVFAGGMWIKTAPRSGMPVIPTTQDIITMDPGTATINVDVLILADLT